MIDRIVKDKLLWKAMEIEVRERKLPIVEIRGLLIALKELSRNWSEMKSFFYENGCCLTETDLKHYFEKEPITETEIKQAKEFIANSKAIIL